MNEESDILGLDLDGLAISYEEACEQVDTLFEENKELLSQMSLQQHKFDEYIKRQQSKRNDAELSLQVFELKVIAIKWTEMLGYIKQINDKNVQERAIRAVALICGIAVSGANKPPSSSPSVRHFTLTEQAKAARVRRSASPMERALNSAIETELAGATVLRPAKEAEAMLDAVNRRLKEAGFETVKVDVVRRRLEKRARS
jgi:hypothetical protein